MNKNNTVEIEKNVDKELSNIDESRLPKIISERVEILEKSHRAYSAAKENEKISRKKVEEVLKGADKLIQSAKNRGSKEAETRKFMWKEYTKKKDDIEVIKENLKDLIDSGIKSAEAHKELILLQSALSDTQTSLLTVQETQMEYQRHIAEATKFLYGLSAYSMAANQSVLVNLQAVLSGASKEKIGEMAQNQLFMAMDQIKNQESIIIRLNENKKQLESINSSISIHNEEMKKIVEKNIQQDEILRSQAEKDEEHDRLIKEGKEYDQKQDEILKSQAEKDEEHDRLIKEREEYDQKQDEILKNQAEKDEEHDGLIKEGKEYDQKQDEILKSHAEKITCLEIELKKLEEEKTGKQVTKWAYIIAVISFILAMVQFFI